MSVNNKFLANYIGRKNNDTLRKSLNFHEWLYKNIKKDTQAVIDKGYVYLIDEYVSKRDWIKGIVEEMNSEMTNYGLLVLKNTIKS